MKRLLAMLALGTMPALAACGQRANEAPSADVINHVATVGDNEAVAATLPPAANEAETGPEVSAEPPAAKAGASKPRAAPPRSAPRAEPVEPPARAPQPQPADPHAGHDMGNMADMSH